MKYDHTKEVLAFALSETLAFLRALHWSHQQAMWSATSYSEMMLFEKLSWSMDQDIKNLAEKCITFFGEGSIEKKDQAKKMSAILGWVSGENNLKEAERLEDRFLGYLLSVYEMVVSAKRMTMGLDILLQEMAKTHEQNLFILRQELKGKKGVKVGSSKAMTQRVADRKMADRVANAFIEKQGFNKYNVPELVGQLMSVLEKNGLEDTVAELKQKGFTKIINKAWQNRER